MVCISDCYTKGPLKNTKKQTDCDEHDELKGIGWLIFGMTFAKVVSFAFHKQDFSEQTGCHPSKALCFLKTLIPKDENYSQKDKQKVREEFDREEKS